MKKLLATLSYAALSMSCVSPLAADYYPTAYNSCCGSAFNGFYIGGNLGFVSHGADRNDLDAFFLPQENPTAATAILPSIPIKSTSWTAGVQLGYDWSCSCSNVVLGLVADWNWSNAEGKTHVLTGFAQSPPGDLETELRWFTTIRARAGYSVCDKLLVHITGGAAVADIKTRVRNVDSRFSFDQHRWGWTGGIGGEYALGCNWGIGAEILYMRFEKKTHTVDLLTGLAPGPHSFDLYDDAWVGRINVNYRFCL